MKQLLSLAIAVSIVIAAHGQHNTRIVAENFAGIDVGEHGSKANLQTVIGASKGAWFAGAGTGIDWYYKRSVPVFLSIARDLLHSGNRSLYARVNGGVNYPWKTAKQASALWGYENGKQTAGLYWTGGIGYRIGIGKKHDAILMEVAYSYKKSGEKMQPIVAPVYYSPYMLEPSVYNNNQQLDYRLRRVSIRLGYRF